MSYQVLARKYRPMSFAEVVGQQHVTQTLQNALEQKRIHHAYLFTGARGVGKTTVARLLAKALNCEAGALREPCNKCAQCLDVTQGSSLDVQEIDGASNTGVDDVRQIREQTKYMPARGKYKIYIIDEVHMLSTAAFNALLKTLEEPPPHVIFIFATTEAHKIPVTILSRCQRYDFRRIGAKDLVSSLTGIVAAENAQATAEALHLIAHEAGGSLRDAQSLLDQAITFCGSEISYEKLKIMLGFLDRSQLWQLLGAILKKNRQQALQSLEEFYQSGVDMERLAQDLAGYFHHLLILAASSEMPTWIDLPSEELDVLKKLSGERTLPELDQLFNLAYRAAGEIAYSSNPKMLLDIWLVRMTLVGEISLLSDILQKLEQLPAKETPAVVAHTPVAAPVVTTIPVKVETPTGEAFIHWLEGQKPQLASILKHSLETKVVGDMLICAYESDSVYGEMLTEPDRQKQLDQLTRQFFKKPLTFKMETKAGQSASAGIAEQKEQDRMLKTEALSHVSVKEAANILGAVVQEVRTQNKN